GAEMARIAGRVCGEADGGEGAAGLLAATAGLAVRCALDIEADLGIGKLFIPEIAGEPLALLRARCAEGMDRRFPRPGRARAAARERLAAELGIIATTGLASYFLT